MRKPLVICLLLLLYVPATLYGQGKNPAGKVAQVHWPYYIVSPDSGVVFSDTTALTTDTLHKNRKLLPFSNQLGKAGYTSYVLMPATDTVVPNRQQQTIAPVSNLLIHGNILYNVDYRSYIDTPFAENNIYYHTVQTYLDVVYKRSYPMRVYVTSRFSNSAYSKTFFDVSTQFNSNDFKNRIRQTLKNYATPGITVDSLALLENQLNIKSLELNRLQGWMKDPVTIQRRIEEKERLFRYHQDSLKTNDSILDHAGLYAQLVQKASLPGYKMPAYLNGLQESVTGSDSFPQPLSVADSSYSKCYQNNKKRIDTLQQELAKIQQVVQVYQQKMAEMRAHKNDGIDEAISVQDLQQQMKVRNIPDSALPEGYKTLWAVKSFAIGRSIVDYSELSAKNISINGVQVEYNPSYYIAFATGTIDYRFRDFIVKGATLPGQYLFLARVGKGQKNGNNIIFTWYTGKKQLYNTTGSTTATTPDYHLMGFTVEGNYKINPTTLVTVEVAKSSLPFYNQSGTQKSLLSSAVRFNEHSNEAYSVKMQSLIPRTQTKLTGFYKRYGANFQSFSLITTGTQQQAWMIKVDQPFFRKRVLLTSSLKENDYSNPASGISYHGNTVFKSIQATVRMPRWPVLMLGYYPSVQLTKLSNGDYIENTFYSLVGSMNYYYKVKDISMSSTAMYTRFYNKASDSGFIYANTSNFLYNHALFFRQLTYQVTASVALANYYNLYTLDNDMQYSLLQWLKVGAGVKYNRQTTYNIVQMGYRGSAAIIIHKMGQVQLMIEKGFIPGANKQLVENTTGRFSFFKIF